MYSFIVNSINDQQLERLQRNLAHVLRDTEWELVHIPDAKNMCEGYNRGLARARGDHLIFCHDDIEFLPDNICSQLAYAFQYSDLFGVLGSRVLCSANWMRSCQPHTLGYIAQLTESGNHKIILCGLEDTLMFGVQALDGVMIGCHRHVAEQLRWDEQIFDGWHGYDVDFTYRAFQAGFNIAVVGFLPLVHYSTATFQSDDFKKYESAFSLKYPGINAERIPGKDSAHLVFGEFDPSDGSLMRWLTDNFHSLIQQTGNLRAQCAIDAIKLITPQGYTARLTGLQLERLKPNEASVT
ncbi:MAG: glycosyltransferase [Burkholderiaceae bacterium]